MTTQELLLEVEKHFGIGCRKICQERHEQIYKHGRTIELDVKYNTEGQLLHASRVLTMGVTILPEIKNKPPFKWDSKIWAKMCDKEYFEERIVISGSLTAAEIDRLNAEINEIFTHKIEPTE